MSRQQAGNISQEAQSNSGADQTAATTARNAETADIGSYEQQLSKFAASNPYTEGGAYQTAQNQSLAGTADAGSGAITTQEQDIAKRTGENAGAGNAIAAESARANQRGLATGEADANQQRIGAKAGYDSQVLSATEVPAQLEAGMYGTSVGAANGALNTAVSANKDDPSFWDEFGENAGTALGKAGGTLAANGIAAAIGCWVAAELYGGWSDARTIKVRHWIFEEWANESLVGLAVACLYLWCGKWLAERIRHYPVLRRVFLPLFNKALQKAEGR